MIRREVIFAPEAEVDLQEIYDWIAENAGENAAFAYIERVETFCRKLDIASERGSVRDQLRPGLRAIGFERSATIAFFVDDDRVTIARIARRGRNWTQIFTDDD